MDALAKLKGKVHKAGELYVRNNSFPYLWHESNVELLKDGVIRWSQKGHDSWTEVQLCDCVDFRESELRHGKKNKSFGFVLKGSRQTKQKKSVHLSSVSEEESVLWLNALNDVCLLLVHVDRLSELSAMDAATMSIDDRLEMANEYVALEDYLNAEKLFKELLETANDEEDESVDFLYHSYEFFLSRSLNRAHDAEQHFVDRTRFFICPPGITTHMIYLDLMEHCTRVRFGYSQLYNWDDRGEMKTDADPGVSPVQPSGLVKFHAEEASLSTVPELKTDDSLCELEDGFYCAEQCVILRPDPGALGHVRGVIEEWKEDTKQTSLKVEYTLSELEGMCNDVFFTVSKQDQSSLMTQTYGKMRRHEQVDMLAVSDSGELRSVLSYLETQSFGRLGQVSRQFLKDMLRTTSSSPGEVELATSPGTSALSELTMELTDAIKGDSSEDEFDTLKTDRMDRYDSFAVGMDILNSETMRKLGAKKAGPDAKGEEASESDAAKKKGGLPGGDVKLPLMVQSVLNMDQLPRFSAMETKPEPMPTVVESDEEDDDGYSSDHGDEEEFGDEEEEEEEAEDPEKAAEEEAEMAAVIDEVVSEINEAEEHSEEVDTLRPLSMTDVASRGGSTSSGNESEPKVESLTLSDSAATTSTSALLAQSMDISKMKGARVAAIESSLSDVIEVVMKNEHKRFLRKYPNCDVFAILLLVWMVRQTETSHIVRPEQYYHFTKRVPTPLLVEAAKAKMETIRMKTAVVDIPVVRAEAEKLGLTSALVEDDSADQLISMDSASKHSGTSSGSMNGMVETIPLSAAGAGGSSSSASRSVSPPADSVAASSSSSSSSPFSRFWKAMQGGPKRDSSTTSPSKESPILGAVKKKAGGGQQFLSIAEEVTQSKTMRTNLNRSYSEERHYISEGSTVYDRSGSLSRNHSLARLSSWTGRFEQSDLLQHKYLLLKVLTVLYAYSYSCFRDGRSRAEGNRERILTIFALGCRDGDPYEVRFSVLTQALSVFHSVRATQEDKQFILDFILEHNLLNALNIESRSILDDFFGATALKTLRDLDKSYDRSFAHLKTRYKAIWKEMKHAFYIDARHEINAFSHDLILGSDHPWLTFEDGTWQADLAAFRKDCMKRGLRCDDIEEYPPLLKSSSSGRSFSRALASPKGGLSSILSKIKGDSGNSSTSSIPSSSVGGSSISIGGGSSSLSVADMAGVPSIAASPPAPAKASSEKTLALSIRGSDKSKKGSVVSPPSSAARSVPISSPSIDYSTVDAETLFARFVMANNQAIADDFISEVTSKIGRLCAKPLIRIPNRNMETAIEMVELLRSRDESYSLSSEIHHWKVNGQLSALRCYAVFDTINALWEAFEILAGPLPGDDETDTPVADDDFFDTADEYFASGMARSPSVDKCGAALRVCLVKNHISTYKPRFKESDAQSKHLGLPDVHYVRSDGVWVARRKTLSKAEKKKLKKSKRKVKKKKDLIKEATKKLERQMELTDAKILQPDYCTGLRYISVCVALRSRSDRRMATIAEVRLTLAEHWKFRERYLDALRMFDAMFSDRNLLFRVFVSFERERRRELSAQHLKWFWQEEILPFLGDRR